MTELELKQLLSRITRPDETARTAAHAHWASLAKPLGGLGRLETMLEDAAALTGTAELAFSRRAVLVLCADNGVVAQGVSQTDQSVTRAVAENLAARRTSVCQMAKTARCEVVPVDLGMAGEPVPGCRTAALPPGRRISPPACHDPPAGDGCHCGGHRACPGAEGGGDAAAGTGRWALATPPPPAPWLRFCWGSPWSG